MKVCETLSSQVSGNMRFETKTKTMDIMIFKMIKIWCHKDTNLTNLKPTKINRNVFKETLEDLRVVQEHYQINRGSILELHFFNQNWQCSGPNRSGCQWFLSTAASKTKQTVTIRTIPQAWNRKFKDRWTLWSSNLQKRIPKLPKPRRSEDHRILPDGATWTNSERECYRTKWNQVHTGGLQE